MRSFFVQIFLSFWLTILLTFVFAALIFPSSVHPSPETSQAALDLAISQLGRLAIERGPGACGQKSGGKFFVLDQRGRDVCGPNAPEGVVQLAAKIRDGRRQGFSRIHSDWAVAELIDDPGLEKYTAVLVTPQAPRTWFPRLPPWSLPVSSLVTFVFAYLLTNPVRALRMAFRRFAAGDMTVRLPLARNALRDWGGADIRTLMIDFNEMADRIQALLEAHKTLLRDVSHELRSPLARLNVALELARYDAGASTRALDRAELESSRLNALIGELLSLSFMETIHGVPNSKPVQMADVVERLMPDLKFEAGARGCRVIYKRRDDCPVLGNEELLRRALENVIRNAIRYSPAGAEVTLEMQTENAEANTKAIVRVCDSGPGVPEESLEAIFRPFYRVDSARQTSTGGAGVGLAIAQRAVQIHGGSIRAFNKQAGGLCVELCLPCDKRLGPS